MEKKKSVHTDEGLQGNERIEEAILALQQEPTEEFIGSHTDGSSEADAGEGAVYRGGGTSGWRWDHEAPDHPDKGWWTLVDGIYRF